MCCFKIGNLIETGVIMCGWVGGFINIFSILLSIFLLMGFWMKVLVLSVNICFLVFGWIFFDIIIIGVV